MRRVTALAISAGLLFLCGCSCPQEQARTAVQSPPPEVDRPYDEHADASADIEAALAACRSNGRRVLVVFGANWCPWCRRLDHTLRRDPGISAELSEGFRVVHVDTGARRSGKNAGVNERYGNPVQHGLPVFVVLKADGSVAATQETGSLEVGDRHDPRKILAFLRRVRS